MKIKHMLFSLSLFLCGILQGQTIPYSIAIGGNENKYATLLSVEELNSATYLLIQHDTHVKYWKSRAKLPFKVVFYTLNDTFNLPDLPIAQKEMMVFNPKGKSKVLVDITNVKNLLKGSVCFVSVEVLPQQWYINNGYLTENTCFYMDKDNNKWYILPQLRCFHANEPMRVCLQNTWKNNPLNKDKGNYTVIVLKR
ncbi:MAG: hypothetical protein J5606_03970 [Bacteroidales bacterium]|nr:hypothetical protein [Bacteroidales bacterium]